MSLEPAYEAPENAPNDASNDEERLAEDGEQPVHGGKGKGKERARD